MPDISTLRTPKSMQTWETTLKNSYPICKYNKSILFVNWGSAILHICCICPCRQYRPLFPWRKCVVHLSDASITTLCIQCLQVKQKCHLWTLCICIFIYISTYRIPQHVICQIANSKGVWSHRAYPWSSLSIKCLRYLVQSTIDCFYRKPVESSPSSIKRTATSLPIIRE